MILKTKLQPPSLKPHTLRRMRLLAITLVIGLVFSSLNCARKEIKPMPGGEVRMAWSGGLVGLDPFRNWGCAGVQKLLRLIFSSLYVSEGNPLNIADRVIPAQDHREWRFLLKRDCFFHDDPCFPNGRGRRLNAYDVQYTYERAESIWGRLEPFDNIREIAVEDSFAVRFSLRRPDSHFMDRLNRGYLFIAPREAIERYQDDFHLHPVGSGSFRLETWDEEKLILARNNTFLAKDRWGQRLPYLDRILIKFSNDPNQTFNALLQGDLDIAPVPQDCWPLAFERDSGGMRLKKKLERDYQLVYGNGPNLTVLGLNSLQNPIFKNPLLRQAVNYGIDRHALQVLLPTSPGNASCGPTTKSLCGVRYEYDLKKARELLAGAGYPGGRGLPVFAFLHYPQTYSREIALQLQGQLERLDLKTKLFCATRPKVLAGQVKLDLEVYTITYSDSNPATQLNLYQSCDNPWVDFRSPAFDSLWRLYESNPSPDSGNALLARMESLVIQNPPFAYLYWSYPISLARRNVQELDPVFLLSPFTWIKR